MQRVRLRTRARPERPHAHRAELGLAPALRPDPGRAGGSPGRGPGLRHGGRGRPARQDRDERGRPRRGHQCPGDRRGRRRTRAALPRVAARRPGLHHDHRRPRGAPGRPAFLVGQLPDRAGRRRRAEHRGSPRRLHPAVPGLPRGRRAAAHQPLPRTAHQPGRSCPVGHAQLRRPAAAPAGRGRRQDAGRLRRRAGRSRRLPAQHLRPPRPGRSPVRARLDHRLGADGPDRPPHLARRGQPLPGPLRTAGHNPVSEPVSLARPRALKEGDRVAVICVSGPVEPEALYAGLDALRFAGLDPVTYPSAHDPGTMRPYLAGDDAMRAGDLRSALTEPGIAGILFARGGYGAQRTLEAMDWDGLVGMPPKVLAGYSDVTAVLEAVAVRLGWASVFGPMVAIREGASHYSFGSLLRTLMRPEQATLIRYPRAVTLAPGLARGVTTGGTLCLLASSLATGTSRPARGGILLLEDVNEEDYRVDRMLTQLRRSGYLDGVAGIVAGTFTGCGPPETIQDILTERLGDLNVPMIAWANVGHGGLFQAFPYGIAAELDAATATLRLLDPPLS